MFRKWMRFLLRQSFALMCRRLPLRPFHGRTYNSLEPRTRAIKRAFFRCRRNLAALTTFPHHSAPK